MNAEIFYSLFFGAVVVETIVNIFANVEEKNTCWKYWAALFVGLLLGVLVAVNYSIDLFELVGLEGRFPVVGMVLTGLIMSRGANLVNDLFSRLNSWRPR